MAEMENQVSDTNADDADDIGNTLASVTAPQDDVTMHPVFKKYRDSAIVVSKASGGLWKARKDAGVRAAKPLRNAQEEAIKYYNNNQLGHRTSRTERSGNTSHGNRINERHTETENIVFATINALVPSIYAKNPSAEFTPLVVEDPVAQDPRVQEIIAFARCCEHLVNILGSRESAPGFAMKYKAKQAVISSLLTNEGWMEYGYTVKEKSSDTAIAQLNAIAAALSVAKDEAEIRDLEGQLIAMEETIEFLQPEGPFARFRSAGDVVVDPDSVMPDHSDAMWMMYRHMFSTSYLNAVYREKTSDGSVRSLFKPTHVVDADVSEENIDSVVNNFKLLDADKLDAASYGYSDPDAFKRAQRTLCWVVWDKTTRRVMLFHNDDWTWPIWVWDDPYGLPTFFPMRKLSFVIPPVGARAIGETAYYLDQQDAINDNNTEMHRARQWISKNIFYDKGKISRDEFEKVMKGGDGTGRGVTVPEGTKLSDHIFSLPPPSVNYLQLFDTQSKIAAIDRITGTSVIMRNEQFKTNTTNEAIGAYTSANQTRLDDKIDIVEDWIGAIYRDIAMLCAKFMPKSLVDELIPSRSISSAWRNMEPREFDLRYPVRVVGGSTQKPTSSAKKKEALSMAQILGQFASATPAVLEVALKVLERAFDEVTISADDWKYIRESITAQLQRGSSTAGGAGPGDVGDQQDVAALIDQLPPQAKQAFMTAVTRGAPARDALAQIIGALQQRPQGTA